MTITIRNGFGSWESLLSIDNKENYSSSMAWFSNDKLDDYDADKSLVT